ncbi:MAG: site-specific DNA-methyltransferase [Bacteroidales bacterium]|nr:site-specific DNA-methyltransferase [Bacteroidales bacterium]
MEKDYRNHTQEELLIKIRELEKEVKKLNHQIIKDDRYGLNWIDCPEAFEEESENKIPILEEVKDKAIKNDDGKPTHILIEGDNYHALTCLNYTHKGKIDVIYIDPPYNTGSDGFTYKDKRFLKEYPDGQPVPKDHPLRHSYWLSFMNKRLKLAKELLSDDGVIFISINEEEYSQLKLLCDNIFLDSNYLTTFNVKVRHEDRILKGDKDFHETTEQLLLYRKSSKFKTIKRLQDNTSIDKYEYKIEELTNNPEKVTMGSKEVLVFKPNEYKIIKTNPFIDNFQKVNIRGSIKEGNSSGRFHMKYLESRNNLFNYLYKVPDIGDDKYDFRYFLSRESDKRSNGFYFQGVPVKKNDIKEVPYANFIDFEDSFNNVGYEGGIEFRNGKKPVDFIRFILSIGSLKKNSIILDFFAGSGSTAHAVMGQNNIDGGNRQFILCTNNENNILTDITYPRINNIIVGYNHTKNIKETLFELPLNPLNILDNTAIIQSKFDFFSDKYYNRYDEIKDEVKKGKYQIYGIIKNTKKVKGFGNSLKYYKTSFVGKNSPKKATDDDRVELSHKAGYLLALGENTLEEIKKTDYYQIFENNDNATAIYFKEDLRGFDDFVKEVENLEKPTSVYIFSWDNAQGFEYNFEHIKQVQIKSIPQAILEIYKSINQ